MIAADTPPRPSPTTTTSKELSTEVIGGSVEVVPDGVVEVVRVELVVGRVEAVELVDVVVPGVVTVVGAGSARHAISSTMRDANDRPVLTRFNLTAPAA